MSDCVLSVGGWEAGSEGFIFYLVRKCVRLVVSIAKAAAWAEGCLCFIFTGKEKGNINIDINITNPPKQ